MSRRVGLKHEQFNTNTQTRTDTCPAHVGWDELSRAHPDVGTFVTLLIIVFTANLATTNNTRENNQRLTRPCYLLSPPTLCPINEASGLIMAMATLCSVTIPRSRLVHCDHGTMWHLGSWLRELEEKCVWQRPESESSWVWGDVPRYLILTVTAIRILVARELLMSTDYRVTKILTDQICYDTIITRQISEYQWHNVTKRNVRIGAFWKCQKYWLDFSVWAVLGARLLTSNYEYLVQRFIETLPPHMSTWSLHSENFASREYQNTKEVNYSVPIFPEKLCVFRHFVGALIWFERGSERNSDSAASGLWFNSTGFIFGWKVCIT